MIQTLSPPEFRRAAPLFRSLDQHLAVAAVVAGAVPGTIHVDNTAAPRSALLRTGARLYLAGEEDNDAFCGALRRLFLDEIYPQALEEGGGWFTLYYPSPPWEDKIEAILGGKEPLHEERRYLTFRRLRGDWRSLIPPGLSLRPVDRALLAEAGLGHLDGLREEMASECPSVEFFLQHHFGFCLASQGELAGWCLSEYNLDGRCEVGIETVESHRRQGVATVTASALVEHALGQGMTGIGWHCYAGNEASIATARKVGFALASEYKAYFACSDPAVNLAVHGNLCFQRQEYAQAAVWYQRAFEAGEAPVWAYVNAAAARARMGEHAAALARLHQAIDQGFADAAHLDRSPHFEGLRGTEGWAKLARRLLPE